MHKSQKIPLSRYSKISHIKKKIDKGRGWRKKTKFSRFSVFVGLPVFLFLSFEEELGMKPKDLHIVCKYCLRSYIPIRVVTFLYICRGRKTKYNSRKQPKTKGGKQKPSVWNHNGALTKYEAWAASWRASPGKEVLKKKTDLRKQQLQSAPAKSSNPGAALRNQAPNSWASCYTAG